MDICRKKTIPECLKLTEARKSENGADYYCNCTLGKLQIAFATKKEADEASSEKLKTWLAKCSSNEDE